MRVERERLDKGVTKVRKAATIVTSPVSLRAAVQHRVAAATEHLALLRRIQPRTVLDVGANRGQFSLAVQRAVPGVEIVAFEPIPEAAGTYRAALGADSRVELVKTALGAEPGEAELVVTGEDDSSSLLEPTELQLAEHPGTAPRTRITVPVTTLDDALAGRDLARPVLLKLDVQGFELEVLRGAKASMATSVDLVYTEVSFREYYRGQCLAQDVCAELRGAGFDLVDIGHVSRNAAGAALQADFLFNRRR